MSKGRWRLVAVLLVAAFVVWVAGCAPSAGPGAGPTKFVSVGTASVGGSWYIVGAAMAKVINKHVPGVRATSETTGGTLENLRLVGTKKLILGLITTDAAAMSFAGEGPFKDAKYTNIRAMFAGHAIYQHIYTLAASPIKAPPDFKGKRVAMTTLGSTGEVMADRTLEYFGLKRGVDYKVDFISFAEAAQGMKDGNIDGAVHLLGIPAGAVVDLTTTREVRFIPLDEATLKGLKEKYPYYGTSKPLPAGTYKGQDKDVPNLSSLSILATYEGADPDVIYKVSKAILENTAEMKEIHPAGGDWTLQNATEGITIPYSPGAEKYLKEKGALK